MRTVVKGEQPAVDGGLWSEWSVGSQRRIVEAALGSFAERGFHATTLKHIARGSGLSTAALYMHFESKEQLLFALSRRGHASAFAVVAAAADCPSPAHALDRVVRAFTHWHAEHHTVARVVQYEGAALTAEHAAEINVLRRDTERLVREVIERGVDAGVFTVADVRVAAAAVLSLGIDVARWYDPAGPWEPAALADRYADLTARMLGSSAAAATDPHGGAA